MQKLAVIRPFILKWEGGKSADPNDAANKDLVPGLAGVHTNKGVTWGAYKDYKAKHKETPWPSEFLEMRDMLWEAIFEESYWLPVRAGEAPSQRMANALADYAWGSGVNRAVQGLQKALNEQGYGLTVDGVFGEKTMAALKNAKEDAVYKALMSERLAFLNVIGRTGSQNKFLAGWVNRLAALLLFNL